MAIPFTLLGLVRVLVVKERRSNAQAEQIKVKDMLKLLFSNKYILLFALMILISNLGSTSYATAQTYYYQYILGNIGVGSIMSLSMLAIIAVIVLMPALSRKFGFLKVIRATTLIGMFGYLIRLVGLRSLPLLFISNMISMMGFYTMFSFASTFTIDCIDYGEWKNGTRTEGTISCAQSVTAKIGTAVGTGIIGVLMGVSGYNGKLDVQPASADTMIVLLYSVIPAAICLVQYILLKLYDMDKIQPQIRADLAKKHAAEEAAAAENGTES